MYFTNNKVYYLKLNEFGNQNTDILIYIINNNI
jgi:hypothetical protein